MTDPNSEVRAAWSAHYPSTPYDLWTRTNVGEVWPNPVTPLSWSVNFAMAERILMGDMKRLALVPSEFIRDGKPPLLIGGINGRLFYNTGLTYYILTERFGLPSWFYNLSLGGPQEGERLGLPPRPLRPLRLARFAPLLLREQRRVEAAVRRFEWMAPKMRAEIERLRAEDLTGRDVAALLARLDFLGRRAGPPFGQIFDGTSAALNTYGLLAALAERWCGKRHLANDLVSGLTNLLTAEATIALWEVAQRARERPAARRIIETAAPAELQARLAVEPEAAPVHAALDRFFAEHGHRAVNEFELAVPRWSEEPGFVLHTVRTYLHAPPEADPTRHLALQAAHREATEVRVHQQLSGSRFPWRWPVFKSVLDRARRFLPMRENPKYHYLLYAAEMRRTILAAAARLHAAGVLAAPDVIFYLTRADVGRLAADTAADVGPLVTARRALYQRLLAWKPPEIVPGRDVAALEAAVMAGGTAGEEHSALEADATPARPIEGAGQLRGIAASGGVATGRARVALTADEGAELEPGEILIAPFTDPGWTPLFTVAGAIVMDLGGLLSHGAIVAREYGIPAVVNTRTATTALRTGQTITVNGDTGEVTWTA
jgi:pyruvate,water dikinase